MIRAALPYLGDMPVVYMTDSSFVLQVLEEQCLFSCHPHDLHQLLSLWHAVSSRVVKQHVRGHSGNPINTLADSAAKAALGFRHFRTIYRTNSDPLVEYILSLIDNRFLISINGFDF